MAVKLTGCAGERAGLPEVAMAAFMSREGRTTKEWDGIEGARWGGCVFKFLSENADVDEVEFRTTRRWRPIDIAALEIEADTGRRFFEAEVTRGDCDCMFDITANVDFALNVGGTLVAPDAFTERSPLALLCIQFQRCSLRFYVSAPLAAADDLITLSYSALLLQRAERVALCNSVVTDERGNKYKNGMFHGDSPVLAPS